MEAKDIGEKQFTVTVFRGYSMEEVDAFLDEVAAELSRLNGENAELREKAAELEKRAAFWQADRPVAERALLERVEELERRLP